MKPALEHAKKNPDFSDVKSKKVEWSMYAHGAAYGAVLGPIIPQLLALNRMTGFDVAINGGFEEAITDLNKPTE
jgi:hypothetical protein